MLKKIHFGYLDSIRGLAALTVITEHFVIAYGLPCSAQLCQEILDYTPLHFWWDGSAAVSMFFVLSGLVLSLKYFPFANKPDLSEFKLIDFTISRLCRIWLPYIMILFISANFYLIFLSSTELNTPLPASDWIIDMWRNHPLSITEMFREGFLLNLPSMIVLIPQAWTLNIELVLSLLLPLGLVLMEKSGVWLIFFALIGVTLLGISVFLIHFLLGLLIASQYVNLSAYFKQHYWRRRGILVIGVLLYTSSSVLSERIDPDITWIITGLGAGLILVYTSASNRMQTILAQPILRQIGKTSYSAYLIHMIILICLTPYLIKIVAHLTEQHFFLWLGSWLLTLIAVQFFSHLCYLGLERPSMVAGKQFAIQRLKLNALFFVPKSGIVKKKM